MVEQSTDLPQRVNIIPTVAHTRGTSNVLSPGSSCLCWKWQTNAKWCWNTLSVSCNELLYTGNTTWWRPRFLYALIWPTLFVQWQGNSLPLYVSYTTATKTTFPSRNMSSCTVEERLLSRSSQSCSLADSRTGSACVGRSACDVLSGRKELIVLLWNKCINKFKHIKQTAHIWKHFMKFVC